MSLDEKSREKYTRVTKVLYPFSGMDKIDPEVLAHAAERGTKVHRICEGIVLGLGEHGVDDETRGYIESFKRWWGDGLPVVSVEERFWDDQLCITGQVDFIIETGHGLAVVDLKTSSKPSKTWQAQGCAYAYLAKNAGYKIVSILFIQLDKRGKIPKIYEYPVDDGFFLAIFKTYLHFFHKE